MNLQPGPPPAWAAHLPSPCLCADARSSRADLWSAGGTRTGGLVCSESRDPPQTQSALCSKRYFEMHGLGLLGLTWTPQSCAGETSGQRARSLLILPVREALGPASWQTHRWASPSPSAGETLAPVRGSGGRDCSGVGEPPFWGAWTWGGPGAKCRWGLHVAVLGGRGGSRKDSPASAASTCASPGKSGWALSPSPGNSLATAFCTRGGVPRFLCPPCVWFPSAAPQGPRPPEGCTLGARCPETREKNTGDLA